MIDHVSYRRILLLLPIGLAIVAGDGAAWGHDVPDRFFDRSVQVTIHADRIRVSYQLSLSQLTLAQELPALVGPGGLSGAGPAERMDRYAEKMGPLVASGTIVKIDQQAQPLQFVRATHRVEDHPRFEFAMELELDGGPDEPCMLTLEDTNFFLEKGRVRMAIRAAAPCELVTSTVPAELDAVEPRSAWEMSPEEQDAARRAEATWRVAEPSEGTAPGGGSSAVADPSRPVTDSVHADSDSAGPSGDRASSGKRLLALLDGWSDGFAGLLLGVAFLLGAVHALTPGHGKTMVAAYLVGERGTWTHAVGLGLTTSLTHTGSVLLVALVLRLVSPALDQQLHTGFSLASGLLVAGLGAWLLLVRLRDQRSRVARSHNHCGTGPDACPDSGAEHTATPAPNPAPGWFGLITLGISGGIVPCWDAVMLLIIAFAQGQLDSAVYLLLSFSAGLATALVSVGLLAVTFRGFLTSRVGSGPIVRALPVVSAATILAVGLYLCVLTLQTPGFSATLGNFAASRTAGP